MSLSLPNELLILSAEHLNLLTPPHEPRFRPPLDRTPLSTSHAGQRRLDVGSLKGISISRSRPAPTLTSSSPTTSEGVYTRRHSNWPPKPLWSDYSSAMEPMFPSIADAGPQGSTTRSRAALEISWCCFCSQFMRRIGGSVDDVGVERTEWAISIGLKGEAAKERDRDKIQPRS